MVRRDSNGFDDIDDFWKETAALGKLIIKFKVNNTYNNLYSIIYNVYV